LRRLIGANISARTSAASGATSSRIALTIINYSSAKLFIAGGSDSPGGLNGWKIRLAGVLGPLLSSF